MHLEKVEHCPICNGNRFQPFLTCKDFTTSGEVFHVEQCSGCNMLLTNPRPKQEDAGAYYKSTAYISHQSIAFSFIDRIYLLIRHLAIRWKYRLVKPYLQGKTLLDFGCGSGSFLHYCSRQGQQCFGVEPSTEARQLAIMPNIHVAHSLDNLPQQIFEVITLWHVLEHIYPLVQNLEQLKAQLSEYGTIFIAVPNWQSPDATHYKQAWAGYDVPRHAWHFSKKNMTQLVEKAGLKVKQIIPMKLDAYYVSLLSEKYLNNNKLSLPALLRGIVQGIRSNNAAGKKRNHSSLIYVVQK